MRSRSLPLLGALTLLLSLLVGPVQAQEAYETALDERALDGDTTGSTFAVQGCFADPTADSTRGPGDDLDPTALADITEFCVDYNQAGLALTVTVPGGTDPNSDPLWGNDGRSSIVLGYTSVGGERREVQMSTQNNNGVFRAIVLGGAGVPELLCEAPASFSAGVYSTNVPSGCLGGGANLEVIAQMRYGGTSSEDAIFDFSPGRGILVNVPLTAPAGAERITRFEGPSRVETAIATSQASYPAGDADGVLIALADNFPDALVAAPLAVTNNAPVLLSFKDSVPQSVRDEALRVMSGPGNIVLLGGTAALADSVTTTLQADGHTVTRAAGDSRFSTSVEVARAANPAPTTIFLAFGGDFPDALIAGAASPTFTGVAVLVDRTGIPGVVQAYLDENPAAQRIAIGPVAAAVAPEGALSFDGPTPSTTAAQLLSSYPAGTAVTMASAEKFPDGLSGGAFAARNGLPLLLSPNAGMESFAMSALESHGPVPTITFFGGNAALSDVVAGQASAFLN